MIPLGLGAWAPIYAGARVHNRRWMTIGAVWSLIAVIGWVVAIASNGGGAGGLLIILGWAGAAATSFAIRDRYREMLGSPFETAVLGAEGRLAERDRARKLARERPALALEMGVGRPDLPNAPDCRASTTHSPSRSCARATTPTGSRPSRILVSLSTSTATSSRTCASASCSCLAQSEVSPSTTLVAPVASVIANSSTSKCLAVNLANSRLPMA